MPINKYKERDLSRMRDMINIESAMFIPKVYGDVFNHDRLIKGEMSQCSYGIPAFPEMRGMHSTKRCHNDTPIFYMPHGDMLFDCVDIHERYTHIPSHYNHDDLYLDSVLDKFDNSLIVRSGLFPDSDHWGASVCRYDEEKVKAYKIPANDRLDMLSRIYKLIKGNKK